MITQSLLPGVLLFILIIGAALTTPIAYFLLWLYRRAVLKGMKVTAGRTDTAAPLPAVATSSQPLTITQLAHSLPISSLVGATPRVRSVRASMQQVTLAYTLAGLTCAVLLASAQLTSSKLEFLPIRLLLLAACYAWPLVLTLSLLAALGWRDQVAFAGVYFIFLIALSIGEILLSPNLTPIQLVLLWLITNGPATLLMATFLSRRIRAVGPLVFTFMLASVAGSDFAALAIGSSDTTVRLVARFAAIFRLADFAIIPLIMLVGCALLGLVGWLLLRWLGRRYRDKWMSDQALLLDALWLGFASWHSVAQLTIGWHWILNGFFAFVAYKLVLWVAFGWFVRPAAMTTHSPTLLLLRVFALGVRSQRLFDALAKSWLRAGPITLIAGPDLVTAIVEPHEFLDFIGGQLPRQFVRDAADLDQRIAQMDTRPDPDGRYRVNEFFCRADTWQMTMRRLAATTDSVLMDLRSFAPSNQGCLYELGQLLINVPLARIILLVDNTTDLAFLEETLHSLWRYVPDSGFNRMLPAPTIRLFRVHSATGAEVRVLLQLLLDQPSLQPALHH